MIRWAYTDSGFGNPPRKEGVSMTILPSAEVSEYEVITPDLPKPDPAAKAYFHYTAKLSANEESFNHRSRKTWTIDVSGMTINWGKTQSPIDQLLNEHNDSD